MDCCSAGGSCKSCPSAYALWIPRIGFGLVIAGYGVNHLRHLSDFSAMAASAYTMPALAGIISVLAYIVPFLMIVGGVLFACAKMCSWSKACILASLGGIMAWAGLAVLVGDGSAGPAMMPMIQNAALLLVAYHVIKKMWKCGMGASCGCGKMGCNCASLASKTSH